MILPANHGKMGVTNDAGRGAATPTGSTACQEARSMTKMIPVADRFALVDDEDYPNLARHRWYLTEKGYAVRMTKADDGVEARTLRMHREVLRAPGGVEVDHVSGDKLDNRKSNLRLAGAGDNQKNCKKHKGAHGVATHSLYKGVTWDKSTGSWKAQISSGGERYNLGRFSDELEAARAYDEAARARHGEYARVNFPLFGEQGCRG